MAHQRCCTCLEPMCSSGPGRYEARLTWSTCTTRPRETCLSRTAAQRALCCPAQSTLLCSSLVLSGVLKPALKPSLWPVSSGIDDSDVPLGRALHHTVQQLGIRNDVHGGECCPKPTSDESVRDGRAAGPKRPRCISRVRANSGSVRSPRLNKRADGEARP